MNGEVRKEWKVPCMGVRLKTGALDKVGSVDGSVSVFLLVDKDR